MLSEGLMDEGFCTAEGVYRCSPHPTQSTQFFIHSPYLGQCMKLLDWALRHLKHFMRRNTIGTSSRLQSIVGLSINATNVSRSIGYMRPLSIWSLQIALRGSKEKKDEEEETKDSVLIWEKGEEAFKPKLNMMMMMIGWFAHKQL